MTSFVDISPVILVPGWAFLVPPPHYGYSLVPNKGGGATLKFLVNGWGPNSVQGSPVNLEKL